MKKLFISMLSAAVLAGCVSGTNPYQDREMHTYEAKGLAIKEKNVGLATVLGILPGGGSFYTENYGIGFVNLLFWPASILWDPINGSNGAKVTNYYATKERVRYLSSKEKKDLALKLETGKVSQMDYARKRRTIEEKYSPDM